MFSGYLLSISTKKHLKRIDNSLAVSLMHEPHKLLSSKNGSSGLSNRVDESNARRKLEMFDFKEAAKKQKNQSSC